MRSAIVSILIEHEVHPRDADYVMGEYDELRGALEHAEEILNTLENFDIPQVEHSLIRNCADQVTEALRKAGE